jgi:hypothetical protein
MSQSVRLLVATARRAIPEIRRLEAMVLPEQLV